MSVEHFPCANCEETVCDCGEYFRCDCGRKWCSLECAEEDGYRIEKEETDRYAEITSCSYCRREEFTDEDMLKFILRKIGFNRAEITQHMINDLIEGE